VEDRIFESFHGRRVGRSGKWGSDGHGLGLSITARILKMHGGGIELVKFNKCNNNKEAPEGASFRITLPKG
ncbi:MAG: hypothetical protein LBQ90_01040, partial [Synergistaceae bacterium]|jgi:signal transduction histidine kinase|nr:hypothetical protein [Synergistaceae bacterium]